MWLTVCSAYNYVWLAPQMALTSLILYAHYWGINPIKLKLPVQ